MKSLSEIIQTANVLPATMQLQDLSPSTLSRIAEIRNSYPTLQSFSAVFSPDQTRRFSQHPTRCITGTAPTLTDLNLSYGETASLQWLIAHLQVFQESLNTPNKMSLQQLDTCAQTIHDSFHYLKTTELMLFFARLLGGMYPVEWHGYVTPNKIVSALRDHFMPWRNDLLYKVEKQEQERREREEASQPAITWEEYCHVTGRDPSEHFPLCGKFNINKNKIKE